MIFLFSTTKFSFKGEIANGVKFRAYIPNPHIKSTHCQIHMHSTQKYLLSEWNILGEWYCGIVIFLVVVHPDLSGSPCVLGKNVPASSRECVRVLFAKDVTYSAARNDLKTSSALPHAKRYFKILSAPHVHFHVVPLSENNGRI